MTRIPKKFNVGGTEIEVHFVNRCDDNDIDRSLLAGGYIEIAEFCNKDDKQSEDCKVNTFYHELTHAILDTMGESELSRNEKFVSCFSSFLTEAMRGAEFKE